VRNADLQAQPAQAARRTAFAAARAIAASASCICSAAGSAWAGVANTAIRPSPSVFTTWPPWRSTAGPKADTQCVTTEVASALPSVSYKPVLPRKSANKMLRSEICVMGTPV
jgi:hypothetical protein